MRSGDLLVERICEWHFLEININLMQKYNAVKFCIHMSVLVKNNVIVLNVIALCNVKSKTLFRKKKYREFRYIEEALDTGGF